MSLSFLLFQSCLFQGTLILGCEVFFSFFLFCIHVPLNAEKAYVNKCERVHLICFYKFRHKVKTNVLCKERPLRNCNSNKYEINV